MIVSVTERGVFRRCRQQWHYSSFNRQSITSLTTPTALSLGALIHKSHEHWLNNPEDGAEKATLRAIDEQLKVIKERYKKAIGVEPADRELNGFLDQCSLVLSMMQNYEKHWGSSLPEGFTLVQPEQTLIVPIPETDHSLEGTLDALMRDESGRLWVLERKTFGSHPKREALDRNDQFLAYAWILNQLNFGEVGGIYYDGMWKRDGSKHSLDELFLRMPLTRSPEEIANFSVQVRDEVMDMASPDLRIYRNIPWQGCWDCQFQSLCVAEFRGEDAAHIRETKYMIRDREDGLGEATD